MKKFVNSLFHYVGYSSREQYWRFMTVLFAIMFTIGCGLTTVDLNPIFETWQWMPISIGLDLLFIPAMVMRRLQDAGYNKWFVILAFTPYISLPFLIIIGFLPTSKIKSVNADLI